jgi:hypothetical protein
MADKRASWIGAKVLLDDAQHRARVSSIVAKVLVPFADTGPPADKRVSSIVAKVLVANVVPGVPAADSTCQPTPFNPYAIDYGSGIKFRAQLQEGIGHKALDSGGAQYGAIKGHPAIGLFHELGARSDRPSFAAVGNRVFVANGGRPVYTDGERTKFAGVLPPAHAPSFRVLRKPLWRLNSRLAPALPVDPEGDPIPPSNATNPKLYHYQNFGGNYVELSHHAELAWLRDTYFAFKCYWRPSDVSGRTILWQQKGDVASGSVFVDCVDGKARVGWYDTNLKQECGFAYNVAVCRPGYWYYIYARKKFPRTDLGSGCWQDTIFQQTAALANDVLCVREFQKSSAGNPVFDYPTHAFALDASTRTFVGATTDLEHSIPGCTATGLVSTDDGAQTYTGNGFGVVTAVPANNVFTFDFAYKFWQWASGPLAGKVYRIYPNATANVLTCFDPDTGALADFSAYAAGARGGVFTGMRLVRFGDVARAGTPDVTTYNPRLFGSDLALDPESGVSRFRGEFSSFAAVVALEATGANPNLFETGTVPADDAMIGTDHLATEIFLGNGPGELHVDNAKSFIAVDVQPYAGATALSSLPNAGLAITRDSAASSANASDPLWKYLETLDTTLGRRRIRVAFYDVDQAQVSNPGPELVVSPAGEDASNPSGYTAIALTGLPISRERGQLERRIFMSLSGGASLFRVADVPDNTSTAVVVEKTESQIADGDELETDNQAPPQCSELAESQNVLAFGNLKRLVTALDGEPVDVPDGVVYSKPYKPVAVPFSNFTTVNGRGPAITAMKDLNGRIVISKRHSLIRLVPRQNLPALEIISPTRGCPAGATMVVHDNRLLFLGDNGPYLYSGGGVPDWVGENLADFFTRSRIDKLALVDAVAAINVLRNQYVVVIRELGRPYTSHRISCELDSESSGIASGQERPAYFRFSHYEGPNLTAIGGADDPAGTTQRFVGGTEEGFLVWLDRADTNLLMLGPTAAVWGDSALVAGAGSTSTKVVVSSGALDLVQAGARGALLKYGATEAAVLFAETGALHLDRPVAVLAANAQALTLGQRTAFWETRWIDMGAPESKKNARFLDIVYTAQVSGQLVVTCDVIAENGLFPGLAVGTATLTLGFAQFNINTMRGRFIKFRFTGTEAFEITELVLRGSDADAR